MANTRETKQRAVKRLTPTELNDYLGTDTFEELVSLLAINMEDALLSLGAKPDKDYSYLQLLDLVRPYVLSHIAAHDSWQNGSFLTNVRLPCRDEHD